MKGIEVLGILNHEFVGVIDRPRSLNSQSEQTIADGDGIADFELNNVQLRSLRFFASAMQIFTAVVVKIRLKLPSRPAKLRLRREYEPSFTSWDGVEVVEIGVYCFFGQK